MPTCTCRPSRATARRRAGSARRRTRAQAPLRRGRQRGDGRRALVDDAVELDAEAVALGGGTKTHCNLTAHISTSLLHSHDSPHHPFTPPDRLPSASFAIGDARFFHAGSPSARARRAAARSRPPPRGGRVPPGGSCSGRCATRTGRTCCAAGRRAPSRPRRRCQTRRPRKVDALLSSSIVIVASSIAPRPAPQAPRPAPRRSTGASTDASTGASAGSGAAGAATGGTTIVTRRPPPPPSPRPTWRLARVAVDDRRIVVPLSSSSVAASVAEDEAVLLEHRELPAPAGARRGASRRRRGGRHVLGQALGGVSVVETFCCFTFTFSPDGSSTLYLPASGASSHGRLRRSGRPALEAVDAYLVACGEAVALWSCPSSSRSSSSSLCGSSRALRPEVVVAAWTQRRAPTRECDLQPNVGRRRAGALLASSRATTPIRRPQHSPRCTNDAEGDRATIARVLARHVIGSCYASEHHSLTPPPRARIYGADAD